MGVSAANFAAAKINPSSEGLDRARQFTQDNLRRWGVDRAVDDTVRVMAELAANALRHTTAGREGAWLGLATSPRAVTCVVLDPSPRRPTLLTSSGLPTAGRGLHVVTALSATWGWSPQDRGKAVWARIPL
ncbi:ATP-binding protein [Streptomyces sp. NPDC002643]